MKLSPAALTAFCLVVAASALACSQGPEGEKTLQQSAPVTSSSCITVDANPVPVPGSGFFSNVTHTATCDAFIVDVTGANHVAAFGSAPPGAEVELQIVDSKAPHEACINSKAPCTTRFYPGSEKVIASIDSLSGSEDGGTVELSTDTTQVSYAGDWESLRVLARAYQVQNDGSKVQIPLSLYVTTQ